jgi:catechol 2,3-dioxygenase-like lactoylglutathione lyase family enzyme
LPQLDHLILNVTDRAKSIEFYTQVMGFAYEGESDPFSLIRVGPDLRIQLAPFGTKGGEHLAFRLTPSEFEETFRRVRERGLEYGDRFDQVGNMRGPDEADGANGKWQAVYFFDPNRHLIEIAHY